MPNHKSHNASLTDVCDPLLISLSSSPSPSCAATSVEEWDSFPSLFSIETRFKIGSRARHLKVMFHHKEYIWFKKQATVWQEDFKPIIYRIFYNNF